MQKLLGNYDEYKGEDENEEEGREINFKQKQRAIRRKETRAHHKKRKQSKEIKKQKEKRKKNEVRKKFKSLKQCCGKSVSKKRLR